MNFNVFAETVVRELKKTMGEVSDHNYSSKKEQWCGASWYRCPGGGA